MVGPRRWTQGRHRPRAELGQELRSPSEINGSFAGVDLTSAMLGLIRAAIM